MTLFDHWIDYSSSLLEGIGIYFVPVTGGGSSMGCTASVTVMPYSTVVKSSTQLDNNQVGPGEYTVYRLLI